MRKELELMETIENYITGKLSDAEKSAFEKRMNADPALQKEVQLQQDLLKGIERAGIKQSVKQGAKKYKFNKNLKNWGLTGLAVVAIATGAVFLYQNVLNKNVSENAPQELPELNEEGNKLWSDADKYLPLQSFEINTDKDTVIETTDGIVIAIPANSFLDANGKTATGTIDLEVKEAIHSDEIMKAGLSTRSDGKLLETGGMFYVNARQNNASLKIDPKNALYAEIPTNEVKPGMQLFQGKRMADGTINWVNPKPIQKDLIPVDILSLDFYPPNYLDSLKAWGFSPKGKSFADSLYYSYATYFTDEYYKQAMDKLFIEVNKENVYDAITYQGSMNDWFYQGIDPSKIKAIWNQKFDNTLLATKEFEERMPYIHRTCDETVLNMYINNLDRNLSTIDSMVATMNLHSEGHLITDGATHPEFMKFAARGDGRVKNGNTNVRILKVYYEERSKMYAAAISKTVNEFWNKNDNLDKEADEKRNTQQLNELSRVADNFKKELDVNITEAYRQLGKKKPSLQPDATYGVPITTTGWNNVDKYVFESTMARTTLDYTDPADGKKAVIKYKPLKVTVNNSSNYDRVLVYLLPDELNSFMRMEMSNGRYEEKLNELMIYKMVCIAYKGEESFYYSQDNVKPGELTVSLIKTTNGQITDNINKLGKLSHSKAMNDELNFIAFEKEESKRQAQLVKIRELSNRARSVIFPCYQPVSDTTAVFSESAKK